VTYDGRTTASGERYDMYRLTAASPDLPLNSYARVTNLQTGESVVVRINDRAPVGSVISLSFAAAHRLDVDQAGPARVRVSWAGVAPPAAVADARDAEPALQRAAMAWPVERLASAELEAWPEGRRRLFSSRTRHAPLRVTWVEAAPTAFAGL
jgi:rare lipoprotein A